MPQSHLNSTLLNSVAYQDQPALLELEFRHGAVYQYSAVPAEIYDALLRAESKGAYFNRCIRNRFACVRMDGSASGLNQKGARP
jgi:KTSC domain